MTGNVTVKNFLSPPELPQIHIVILHLNPVSLKPLFLFTNSKRKMLCKSALCVYDFVAGVIIRIRIFVKGISDGAGKCVCGGGGEKNRVLLQSDRKLRPVRVEL